jgi:rfaE bifunctional protein kinase chain/domain
MPAVESQKLREILQKLPEIRVLVLGDFFLDQYLVIDPRLAEISVETGLEARQVVEVRSSPGAAGTVCSNLAALGVKVSALGIVGDDGNGYELIRGLQSRGIESASMITSRHCATPAYIKPMKRSALGSEEEMERLDIKNRTVTPRLLQDQLVGKLHSLLDQVDGVIVGDQVEEEDCGAVTAAVRTELARVAALHHRKIFLADSRARIGEFRQVMIKPNVKEGAKAVGFSGHGEEDIPRRLFGRTGRPVFMTCGEEGMRVFDGFELCHCPAVPVSGPLDIVGAGDSASAGIVSALCAGATPREAAEFGNLVASVTVRKLGTTGTASPQEVLQTYEETAGRRC